MNVWNRKQRIVTQCLGVCNVTLDEIDVSFNTKQFDFSPILVNVLHFNNMWTNCYESRSILIAGPQRPRWTRPKIVWESQLIQTRYIFGFPSGRGIAKPLIGDVYAVG